MENSKNPYMQQNSGLGRALPGSGKKVVVAMSGGVDSSVAAALLKEQGYEVIGIALQTTDYSKYLNDHGGGTCCSMKDMEDARRVAEKLDIPFYVLDTEKTFDAAVVNYFVNDYIQGRTPNPCVMCNTKVKFNHLYKKAMDMGADYVATGHYARVSHEPEMGYCLWKARDLNKDQTYFLFGLTQTQLSKTLFPVGHLTKPEVRRYALQFGLTVAEKPDSQEICFVPGSDYAGFIKKRVAASVLAGGMIVYKDGTVIGEHDGLFNFTIGQRKGLGGALERARSMGLDRNNDLCVTRLDAQRNMVVLGPESEIKLWGLWATNVNWVSMPNMQKKRLIQAKIRHKADLVDCEVTLMPDNSVQVKFVEAQRAITPGQAIVFYDGTLCLGGGWIQQHIRVEEEDRPQRAEGGAQMLSG